MRGTSSRIVPTDAPTTEQSPLNSTGLESKAPLRSSGVLQIGKTCCWDMSSNEGKESALLELGTSGPRIVRVIGACPERKVFLKARRSLLAALAPQSFTGAVLIGGTETDISSDPGRSVLSIPKLGADLQRMLSTDANNQSKIFGTIPTNAQSRFSENKLVVCTDAESNFTVRMHRDLQRALLFPGNAPYLWNQEADGVVDSVWELLKQNPALQYHVFQFGGGEATKREFERTVHELATAFPGQVHLSLPWDSGGVTTKLARQRQPDAVNICGLTAGDFARELERSSPHSNHLQISPEAPVGLPRPISVPSSTMERIVELTQAGDQPLTPRALRRVREHTEALVTSLQELENGQSDMAAPVESISLAKWLQFQSEMLPLRLELRSPSEVRVGDTIDLEGERCIVAQRLHQSSAIDATLKLMSFDGTSVHSRVESLPISPREPLHVQRAQHASFSDHPHLYKRIHRDVIKLLEPKDLLPGDVLVSSVAHLTILNVTGENTLLLRTELYPKRISAQTMNFADIGKMMDEALWLDRREIVADSSDARLRKDLLTIEKAREHLDPTKDITMGSVLIHNNERFVIIDNAGTRRLVTMRNSEPVLLPTTHLIGKTFHSAGARSTFLIPRSFASLPDSPPGWNTLRNGGLLCYYDFAGKLIAHEEVLSVRPAYGADGEQLDYTHQAVRSIRWDHEHDAAMLTDSIRSELSLAIPGGILPGAYRVDVYGAEEGEPHTPKALTSSFAQRRERTPMGQAQHDFGRILDEMSIDLNLNGREIIQHRIERLAAGTIAEDLLKLRGPDEDFEAVLRAIRENSLAARSARQDFLALCSAAQFSGEQGEFTLSSLRTLLSTPTYLHDPTPPLEAIRYLRHRVSSLISGPGSLLHDPGQALIRDLDVIEKTAGTIAAPNISRDRSPLRVSLLEPGFTPGLEKCAELAENSTLDHGLLNDIKKLRWAMQQHGGFIDNDLLYDYLLEHVEHHRARIFTVTQEDGPNSHLAGFSMYYPAGSIPRYYQELVPALRDSDSGYLAGVCVAPSADPTTSILLNRIVLADLQQSDTKNLYALICALNLPSLRSAYTHTYEPTGDERILLKLPNGEEVPFVTMRMPVSPELRQAHHEIPRKIARQQIERIHTAASADLGFLEPTLEENFQMQAVRDMKGDVPFTRFSIGVGSLTPDMQHLFCELIDEGTFAGMKGVVTWGPSCVARRRADEWVKQETGGHSALTRIAEQLSPEAAFVGIATMDRGDPNCGKLTSVLYPDGTRREYAVAHTDTSDGSVVSLVDTSVGQVIRAPVTIPANYSGNLGVWHVEGLRAESFANRFTNSATFFASGGGVIHWEIMHLLEQLEQTPSNGKKLVLLGGLGGATDLIAADAKLVQKHIAAGAARGEPYLYIFNVNTDRAALKEFLRSSGRVD